MSSKCGSFSIQAIIRMFSFANIENGLQMLVMNAKQKSWKKMKNKTVEEVITIWKIDKKTYRRKKYGVEKTSGV